MRDMGNPIVEYNQVVGNVSKMFKTVGVCGTHGKTTTSLLIMIVALILTLTLIIFLAKKEISKIRDSVDEIR